MSHITQAIEALESCTDGDYSSGHVIHPHFDRAMVDSALAVLHAALAQPEPVGINGLTEAETAATMSVRGLSQPEPHSDDIAVDAMAAAMKAKLAKAREKGRGGWETCSQNDLSRMLREHVDKGDPRDVANLCAFLYALGFGIEKLEPVELTEDQVMAAVSKSGCYGTVKMSYESGPYDIDKPTLNATKFARAVLAAAKGGAL